ncbi:hypothetical protein MASR2M48_00220 [Spirochaetota bacterium]|jgi:hypothetical protein
MKKIGILLAILLVAGVCAMADEAVCTRLTLPSIQSGELFDDIDAIALSSEELVLLEGDGFGSAVLGAFSGAVVGSMVEAGDMCIRAYRRTERRSGKEMQKALGDAAVKGAIGGFAIGWFAPLP